MKYIFTFCCFYLTLSLSAQTERIIDWVLPKEIVKKKFELNSVEFNRASEYEMLYQIENDNSFFIDNRKYYYDSDNNTILVKEIDIDGNINILTESNVYFMIPENSWKYAEIKNNYIICKSYWEESKDNKYLVIERINYDTFEKNYFLKNKGFEKKEIFNLKSKKLVEIHNLIAEESKELSIKDKNPIVFPDGKIVKEYKIIVEVDEGLPYLSKDTLTIKNYRALENIPAPKYDKKTNRIVYDGKEYGSEVESMKIRDIKYFKQPFSFSYKLYYFDGVDKINNVTGRNLNFDIRERFDNSWSLSENFEIGSLISKDSSLYLDLIKGFKKQGIYVKVNKTNEENFTSTKILFLNYQLD